MEERKGRGGRRPGAGRKRTGLPKTETIMLPIAPQTKQGLAAAAKERGVSISQMIEEMFAYYESRKDICNSDSAITNI